MSSNSTSFNNGQQLQVNTNLAKLFPYEKEMVPYVYTNSTYDDQVLAAGTVLGVVSATGEVVPFESDAADGSQYPCLVLAEDYTVPAGESINVYCAFKGWVRTAMLVFTKVGDDTETVIACGANNRRVFEILQDRFVLTSVTNATNYDNQLS